MVVDVPVDLHSEEFGGDELTVLGIPLRERQLGGIVGEGTARVLVHADRDADVVLAQPDCVGAELSGAGGRCAGVEHVGERDPGEADEPGHRIRVTHLVAAADPEFDVFPLETGVVSAA